MRPVVVDRSCTRTRMVLSLALDGEAAAPKDVLAATRHLRSCSACVQFADRVTAVTRALRSVRAQRPGAHGSCSKGEGHETC
jgi:predicted anti-sigma-YlaC factor YlaD